MKVTGPTVPGLQTSRAAGRTSGGFSLAQPGAAATPAAATAPTGVSGVAGMSALMALQGVEDAMGRRRRAIRRGSGLLDRLDQMKLALLSGEAPDSALGSLAAALREDRPDDDDDGLRAVLDQIDLRAAVELAKADVRRSAA
ncbi:flagellar assembly regulator FliX [Rhizobium sp. CRIBSB]|nr:flagellar assembly regulator FliX [Rhizobium sp. CRIBSB]